MVYAETIDMRAPLFILEKEQPPRPAFEEVVEPYYEGMPARIEHEDGRRSIITAVNPVVSTSQLDTGEIVQQIDYEAQLFNYDPARVSAGLHPVDRNNSQDVSDLEAELSWHRFIPLEGNLDYVVFYKEQPEFR